MAGEYVGSLEYAPTMLGYPKAWELTLVYAMSFVEAKFLAGSSEAKDETEQMAIE